MIFTSWIGLILFIKLSVIIGRKLGLSTLPQEEIPFFPFRFITDIRWYPHKFWITCRVQLPECFDIRRSDFFIPNGTYSDFALFIWGIMSLTLMYLGMWKLVFFSLPALVFTLKATDVVGRKFGYNILRSSQEMSFYPIRLMKIQKRQNCLKNNWKLSAHGLQKSQTSYYPEGSPSIYPC